MPTGICSTGSPIVTGNFECVFCGATTACGAASACGATPRLPAGTFPTALPNTTFSTQHGVVSQDADADFHFYGGDLLVNDILESRSSIDLFLNNSAVLDA